MGRITLKSFVLVFINNLRIPSQLVKVRERNLSISSVGSVSIFFKLSFERKICPFLERERFSEDTKAWTPLIIFLLKLSEAFAFLLRLSNEMVGAGRETQRCTKVWKEERKEGTTRFVWVLSRSKNSGPKLVTLVITWCVTRNGHNGQRELVKSYFVHRCKQHSLSVRFCYTFVSYLDKLGLRLVWGFVLTSFRREFLSFKFLYANLFLEGRKEYEGHAI